MVMWDCCEVERMVRGVGGEVDGDEVVEKPPGILDAWVREMVLQW